MSLSDTDERLICDRCGAYLEVPDQPVQPPTTAEGAAHDGYAGDAMSHAG